MPGRRAYILILGAALGAAFLYLAVRQLDWHAFYGTLAHAHAGQVALGLACLFAYFAVKALRCATSPTRPACWKATRP